MTLFQLIASTFALFMTLYAVPNPLRNDQRMTTSGMAIWAISVAIVVISFVGLRT